MTGKLWMHSHTMKWWDNMNYIWKNSQYYPSQDNQDDVTKMCKHKNLVSCNMKQLHNSKSQRKTFTYATSNYGLLPPEESQKAAKIWQT